MNYLDDQLILSTRWYKRQRQRSEEEEGKERRRSDRTSHHGSSTNLIFVIYHSLTLPKVSNPSSVQSRLTPSLAPVEESRSRGHRTISVSGYGHDQRRLYAGSIEVALVRPTGHESLLGSKERRLGDMPKRVGIGKGYGECWNECEREGVRMGASTRVGWKGEPW